MSNKDVTEVSQLGAAPIVLGRVPLTYTLQHAAAALDLSIPTLRRLERAGRLRFVRIGGRTLVCANSLQALASGGSRGPATEGPGK